MADNFVFWLKTEKECNHNHSIKHLQLVKQVLRFAMKQELIQKNPLQHYSSPLEKYLAPVTLSIEELERIGSYPFDKPYLSQIADLLIFQAYTGFAYVDLKTFNPEKHMYVGSDGTNRIRKERQKSSELALLPLFPKAKQIIGKYDHKLPLISNQKYNEYLKEVAQLVGN